MARTLLPSRRALRSCFGSFSWAPFGNVSRTAFFSIEGAGKPGKLVEMDDTETMFSNPSRQATIDYVTGRFG